MNYLTHFYHNQRILGYPLTADEYYWGTVFPDMARVFDRRLRIRLSDVLRRTGQSGELSFWNGLRNHIQADQAFHNAPFFFRLQKSYADYLDTAEPVITTRQRRIIAHLGVELLFDHYLYTHEPEIALRFYEVLGAVSMDHLMASVKTLFGKTEKMELHLQSFLKSAFLLKYHDLNFLTEVMIYKMGISRKNIPRGMKGVINKSLDFMQPSIRYCFPELVQLLHTVR